MIHQMRAPRCRRHVSSAARKLLPHRLELELCGFHRHTGSIGGDFEAFWSFSPCCAPFIAQSASWKPPALSTNCTTSCPSCFIISTLQLWQHASAAVECSGQPAPWTTTQFGKITCPWASSMIPWRAPMHAATTSAWRWLSSQSLEFSSASTAPTSQSPSPS